MNTQDNNTPEPVIVNDGQAWTDKTTVARLEADKQRYRDWLLDLAGETLSLAESLDWEIGDGLKESLKRLERVGILFLPTKSVTLTGTLTRVYTYSVDVEVAVFDEESDIDHREHEDTILENLDDVWDVIDTTIEAD